MLSKRSRDDKPVLIFPEGTTTAGRHLLPFRTGAFAAGVPVHPKLVLYDTTGGFSPAWESIAAPRFILYLLATLSNRVTILHLPPYIPSASEVASPALYASNVRAYMLKHSPLAPSDATLEDKRRYERRLQEVYFGAKPAAAEAAAAAGDKKGR